MIAMESCKTSIPALTTLHGYGCLAWLDDIHEKRTKTRTTSEPSFIPSQVEVHHFITNMCIIIGKLTGSRSS
jgi:hypothetical protein